MSARLAYLFSADGGSAMWHLLMLPFILMGALISGAFAVASVALFSVFLIPFILLAVFFRIGFFFLKLGAVVVLLALLVSCV
ncbi:MAG TPA: hypothetical protein VGG69_04470 [Rhizomicrobium sp.]